jgi:hypothetical protein
MIEMSVWQSFMLAPQRSQRCYKIAQLIKIYKGERNMKLVYIKGKPYWMTPEGRFIEVYTASVQEYGGLYHKTPEGTQLMGQREYHL